MRQTSIEAYRQLKESGMLGHRQWQAYDCLFHHGPLTGNELCKECGVPGMWKRCSELQRKGLVYESGLRICRVTGKEVMTWDVTNHLTPEEIPQQPELFASTT